MNRITLSSKWWYRLLKVGFILGSILILALVCGVVYSKRSNSTTIDPTISFFRCSDGASYRLSEIPSHAIPAGEDTIGMTQRFCLGKKKGNILWKLSSTDAEIGSGERRNYPNSTGRDDQIGRMELMMASEYNSMSLGYEREWTLPDIIPFLVTILLLELVRRMFFYIVIGRFLSLRD